jgi:transposase
MTVRAALPDLDTLNHEALKSLILSQPRTLAAQEEELHSKDEQLASHQAEIERLKLLISKLKRMQFGRKSEKLARQIEQLELQLDELETAQAEKAEAVPSPETATRATESGRPVRRPLPPICPARCGRSRRKKWPAQIAEAC